MSCGANPNPAGGISKNKSPRFIIEGLFYCRTELFRFLYPYLFRFWGNCFGAAALELLEAAGGVEELDLARICRVALVADFNSKLGLGSPNRKRVSACALHLSFLKIFRMYLFFSHEDYYTGRQNYCKLWGFSDKYPV